VVAVPSLGQVSFQKIAVPFLIVLKRSAAPNTNLARYTTVSGKSYVHHYLGASPNRERLEQE
jgi:hypothetical protein